jgi:hypothetical protein
MSLTMKYFVLKPRAKNDKDIYALASRSAMRRYADIISNVDTDLADQLIEWVEREEENALDFSRQVK